VRAKKTLQRSYIHFHKGAPKENKGVEARESGKSVVAVWGFGHKLDEKGTESNLASLNSGLSSAMRVALQTGRRNW